MLLDKFLVFPATVIVDCAEQYPFGFDGIAPDLDEDGDLDPAECVPYTFGGIRADARQGRLPLLVPRKVRSLLWGDYSLEGHELRVAVERKSFLDLFATFGGRRDEFESEIAGLNTYTAAAVVIEAPWWRILKAPPKHSKLNPLTIWRTVIAWSQRYPRVSWWPCEDREFAERTAFRFLERYYRDLTREAGDSPLKV